MLVTPLSSEAPPRSAPRPSDEAVGTESEMAGGTLRPLLDSAADAEAAALENFLHDADPEAPLGGFARRESVKLPWAILCSSGFTVVCLALRLSRFLPLLIIRVLNRC